MDFGVTRSGYRSWSRECGCVARMLRGGRVTRFLARVRAGRVMPSRSGWQMHWAVW
jgi:hypothetical protein